MEEESEGGGPNRYYSADGSRNHQPSSAVRACDRATRRGITTKLHPSTGAGVPTWSARSAADQRNNGTRQPGGKEGYCGGLGATTELYVPPVQSAPSILPPERGRWLLLHPPPPPLLVPPPVAQVDSFRVRLRSWCARVLIQWDATG